MSQVSKIRPAWVATHRRLEDELLERLARFDAVQTIVRRESRLRTRVVVGSLLLVSLMVFLGCAFR